MSNRDAKWAAWVLMVMALARPASGALLTLSSVEMITSFSVPLSCIFAYNTPIFGCELADFMNANQCSDACKQALERVESNIRASCVTVDAKPNTLIYEAQNGNLVSALCQKSNSKPSSTRPPPPPPPPSSSTTSCDDSNTCAEPTVTSTITATTRITPRPVPTSTISDEETSSPSSTSIESTSSSSKETSSARTTTTTQVNENEAISSTSSVSTPAATTTEIRPAQIPGSGGGSPFEIPLDQLAQGTRVDGRLLRVAIAFFAAVLL